MKNGNNFMANWLSLKIGIDGDVARSRCAQNQQYFELGRSGAESSLKERKLEERRVESVARVGKRSSLVRGEVVEGRLRERREEGVAIIEAALSIFVVLAVIFALIDITLWWSSHTIVHYAANAAGAAASYMPNLDIDLVSGSVTEHCAEESRRECIGVEGEAEVMCLSEAMERCVSGASFDCVMYREALKRVEDAATRRLRVAGTLIGDIGATSRIALNRITYNAAGANCISDEDDYRVGVVRPGEHVTIHEEEREVDVENAALPPLSDGGRPEESMVNLLHRHYVQVEIQASYKPIFPFWMGRDIPIRVSGLYKRQEVPRGAFGEIHNAAGGMETAPADPRATWTQPVGFNSQQVAMPDVANKVCMDVPGICPGPLCWQISMGGGGMYPRHCPYPVPGAGYCQQQVSCGTPGGLSLQ